MLSIRSPLAEMEVDGWTTALLLLASCPAVLPIVGEGYSVNANPTNDGLAEPRSIGLPAGECFDCPGLDGVAQVSVVSFGVVGVRDGEGTESQVRQLMGT